MIDQLLHHASQRASHAAGTAAIGVGAAIAMIVGLGFWCAAGWMFLLTVTTALNAALIMGAVFFGAGLILISVVGLRRRHVKVKRPVQPADAAAIGIEGIIGAFVTGMTAGSQARSSRH